MYFREIKYPISFFFFTLFVSLSLSLFEIFRFPRIKRKKKEKKREKTKKTKKNANPSLLLLDIKIK